MSPISETIEAPCEVREAHSRLIKCGLAVDESRAYWERIKQDDHRLTAQVAFEEYWFGAKSLPWVKVLVLNMQTRFDAFPEALEVLRRWHTMAPETRTAICHWHLQLTDPLYRAFSGDFLPARREGLRPEVRRGAVVAWIEEQSPSHWTLPSRIKLASRLLSAALTAGLVSGQRDPRQLTFPRITDEALAYVLHLLRAVTFEGTLLRNPYLRSVGLEGASLESRLRSLPMLRYRRTSDVIEFGWSYPTLGAWAAAELFVEEGAS